MRPKKNVLQKQNSYVQFRINQKQYDKLEKSGKVYNLSPSLYAKKLALQSHLRQPYFNQAQAIQMLTELSKQGTNLNQIAKNLNQVNLTELTNDQVINAYRLTYGVLDQTKKEYQKLWQLLQK